MQGLWEQRTFWSGVLWRGPAAALLAGAFVVGCDRGHPLEPDVLAASAQGGGAPSINAAAPSYDRIDVTWSDNTTNESGFQVYRSTSGPGGAFALLATKPANVTLHSDLGLTAATQYCYQVRSFKTGPRNTNYSSLSAVACATTPLPPAPPEAPVALNAGGTNSWTAALQWGDVSSTEDGFRIERSGDGGTSWVTAGTTRPNNFVFYDGPLVAEQTFCYRVFAFNGRGDSGPSNTDCALVLAEPSNLVAVSTDGGQTADLTWEDNSTHEDRYEVWVGSEYEIWFTIASLPAGATSYRDVYDDALGYSVYWVVAVTDDGDYSSLSNAAPVPFGSAASASTRPPRDAAVGVHLRKSLKVTP